MKTQTDWQFSHGEEPQSHVRIKRLAGAGLTLAILTLLTAAGAPLARMGLGVPSMDAFRVFMYAAQFGLVLAGLGLLLTLIAAFLRAGAAMKRAMFMVVIGLLPLASAVAVIGPDRFASPMIHDITTDTNDPPVFDKARELRKPGENTLDYGGADVAGKQRAAGPDLGPIITARDPDRAFNRAVDTVMELGWDLINADAEKGIIEAYDTTRFFGFVDDVVIRVRPHRSGARIDVRSVSRVGLGDAGKNAARIQRFIEAY